jgi:hypothetical protein
MVYSIFNEYWLLLIVSEVLLCRCFRGEGCTLLTIMLWSKVDETWRVGNLKFISYIYTIILNKLKVGKAQHVFDC